MTGLITKQRGGRSSLHIGIWVACCAVLVGAAGPSAAAGDGGLTLNVPNSSRTARALPLFVRLAPPSDALAIDSAFSMMVMEPEARMLATSSLPTTDMKSIEGRLGDSLILREIARADESGLSDKDLDDLQRRLRPGFVAIEPYKVPFVRTDVIAPHLAPDIEVTVSDRTKLGVFGQVGRSAEPKAATLPNLLNRPLGAGVTLEYRFGTK